MALLLGVAFLVGVITAVSPCALPVLPIVFAGGASGSSRRPLAIIAGVVVGFTGSLLAVSWVLRQLHLPQDLLRNISIALLFVVAATLLVPRLGQVLERPLARFSRRPGGDLGGFPEDDVDPFGGGVHGGLPVGDCGRQCENGGGRASHGKTFSPQRHRGHREDKTEENHFFCLLCVLCASVVNQSSPFSLQ